MQSVGRYCGLHIADFWWRIGTVRIDQHRDDGSLGRKLAQDLDPFLTQLCHDHGRAGGVAARTVIAGDKAGDDRVDADDEHNGNCRGRGLGRQSCWRRLREDHISRQADQLGRQRRQPVVIALCPAVLDRDIASWREAVFAQATEELGVMRKSGLLGDAAEPADHRHRRLLRPRRKRPGGCRAAEERDELATFPSMEMHGIPASLDLNPRYTDAERRSAGYTTMANAAGRSGHRCSASRQSASARRSCAQRACRCSPATPG